MALLLSAGIILIAGWVWMLAEPGLALGIIGASIGSLAVLAVAGFRPFSMVFIAGLTHFVYYPLAAFLNLLLEVPAVRPDLWDSVALAMAGGAIGCISLAAGTRMAWFFRLPPMAWPEGESCRCFNLMCFSLHFLALFLLIRMGAYYHAAIIGRYGTEYPQYMNILSIMMWIGNMALFLQLHRYYTKRSWADGLIALGMLVTTVVLYAPSGSRTLAFQSFPLLFLLFIALERRIWAKFLVAGAGIIVVMSLLATLGIYRDLAGMGILSEREGGSAIAEAFRLGMEHRRETNNLIVYRVSDFVAVGRIIDYTPIVIPYRGFDRVGDWWQMFVPGFLRPDIDLGNDGARETLKYGVSLSTSSSSPVMIIGDLFGRWGWLGVAAGMSLIGFVLGVVDRWLLRKCNPFSVVFFVLFGREILFLVSSSVLNVFVILTRELILMLVMTYALTGVAGFMAKGFTLQGKVSG